MSCKECKPARNMNWCDSTQKQAGGKASKNFHVDTQQIENIYRILRVYF